jgi:hypothetical protein
MELRDGDREDELKRFQEAIAGLSLMDGLRVGGPQSDADAVPDHLGKDPEAIITDYLVRVARYWYATVTKSENTAALRNAPVDIVVTHPAVCELFFGPLTYQYFSKSL